MNVKEIITAYLKEHGYDGLFDDDAECGCILGDLMPCDSEGIRSCEPGYRRKSNLKLGEDFEYDWIIGPNK